MKYGCFSQTRYVLLFSMRKSCSKGETHTNMIILNSRVLETYTIVNHITCLIRSVSFLYEENSPKIEAASVRVSTFFFFNYMIKMYAVTSASSWTSPSYQMQINNYKEM